MTGLQPNPPLQVSPANPAPGGPCSIRLSISKNLLVCKCLSAFPQLNNLEKAVAAAHTFLKRNPTDPSLTKNMKYYKTLFDVEEYLVDHEERPYEVRCRASCGYEK